MAVILERPTSDAVRNAEERFDKENRAIEDALGGLFTQFPENKKTDHVLLKVTVLNQLYFTRIPLYSKRVPTVFEVVDHIVGLNIDSALNLSAPDLVYKIARTEVANKKVHFNYSFATKYCSWHNPDCYPIYDSRVDECLYHLMNQGYVKHFDRQDLKIYLRLKEIVSELRGGCGLAEFTFKQMDKFLYYEGTKLLREHENDGEKAKTIDE